MNLVVKIEKILNKNVGIGVVHLQGQDLRCFFKKHPRETLLGGVVNVHTEKTFNSDGHAVVILKTHYT